ncbi:MAG: hypothetical protein ACFFA3_06075, partial [Promethearchaeota archaeon]
SSLIFSFFLLITTILSYTHPRTKKITSLFFIRLSFLFTGLFMFFDGMANLLTNETFSRISGMILFPITVCIIIGINFTLKDNFYSIGLLIVFGLGFLLFFSGVLPDSVEVSEDIGFPRLEWRGLFNIMGILFSGITSLYLIYWGIKTLYNAPFLIKKDAFILFFGIMTAAVVGMIFYLLYILETYFIILSNFSMLTGLIIFTFAIIREPKLLYIFPFTVYRIVVKDKEGHPLYDHDWSESNISETIFTGFLNAVQLMSTEVMHIGGLLDINLEGGILVLKESERITVGLVASKSSKLLRDSVVNFTKGFELKFDKELKASIQDLKAYNSAYELIEKYFSNFPYKILKSKKQPLLLTGKFIKIPQELDDKLRSVFTDKQEYEAIKAELIKSPLSMPSEFFKSYSEMKEELKKISGEEQKYLDEDSNRDK